MVEFYTLVALWCNTSAYSYKQMVDCRNRLIACAVEVNELSPYNLGIKTGNALSNCLKKEPR